MASTVHDLIRTAVKAAQNQAAAQTATRTTAAEIAAQRGATPRQQSIPAEAPAATAGGAS